MTTRTATATRWLLALALVASLALLLSAAGPDALGEFPKDQQDTGTGEGGSCSYCSEPRCGCAAAPAGCTLTAQCTCGSSICTVTCTFDCD